MNIQDLQQKKISQTKISVVTCYDYPSAKLVAATDIDIILVGDSVSMVVHGYESTVHATMEMMAFHTQAVARAKPKQLIIGDLPFFSYRKSVSDSLDNIALLMQAGAHCVKLEGAMGNLELIQHVVASGVPVMGHIGLTPQSIYQLGGYKVQGRDDATASNLLQQAKQLEQAGCFSIVLECIPQTLAQQITQSLTIPTIGIGAGPHVDGQVLVWHDLLGLQNEIHPKFVKRFANAGDMLIESLQAYHHEVITGQFPKSEHSY